MARKAAGPNIGFSLDFSDFDRRLQVAISRVERGTKKATIAAAEEILSDSLDRVPRDTQTLAQSAYYEIVGKYRNFSAIIGYGGNGDPINPKTGQPASQYMVVVHEDLTAHHPVGEAKFLENAVRAYQNRFGPNTASIIRSELED